MKVWTKNRNYKILEKKNGWFKVYSEDRVIGTAKDEASARQAIWLSIGGTEYVDEKDFEETE